MQISTFGTADFDHFSRARLRRPKTSIDKLRRLDTPRLQIGPPYKNYSTKKKYDCMYACESSVKLPVADSLDSRGIGGRNEFVMLSS